MSPEDQVRRFLGAAQEDLRIAAELLDAGHARVAASRAYYAVFYAASAALLDRGHTFSKHSAVIAAFAREFVKDGPFDKTMFRTLERGLALRGKSDYDLVRLDKEDADDFLVDARQFVETVQNMLEQEGHEVSPETPADEHG